MPEQVIEQAVFGYHAGHQRLAWSSGLDKATLAELESDSDLTGMLPFGWDWEFGVRGRRVGDWYAVLGTWPDPAAPRGGCVLTHAVLIPLDVATADHLALDRARALLRRPDPAQLFPAGRDQVGRRPVQRQGYEALPLSALTALAVEPTPVPEQTTREALALLFGLGPDSPEPFRPILWRDNSGAWGVVSLLWRYLWPEARASYSFNTMALQPLTRGGVPVTMQVYPDCARGLMVSAPGAHWAGRCLSPRAASTADDRMIKHLVEVGPAWLWQVVEWARAAGLEPTPENVMRYVRTAHLYQNVDGFWTTLVILLDCMGQWFPQLPAGHPWVRHAVAAAFRLISQDVTGYSPMLTQDLLASGHVRALVEVDPEVRDAVDRWVCTLISFPGTLPTRLQELTAAVERWPSHLLPRTRAALEASPDPEGQDVARGCAPG